MSVRKRAWFTEVDRRDLAKKLAGKSGDYLHFMAAAESELKANPPRTNWLVAYRDRAGRRRFETFERKKDADARNVEIQAGLKGGSHVARSTSPTIAQAAEAWLDACGDLERTTLDQYRQHVTLHICPLIGHLKLADVAPTEIRAFEDDLKRAGRSPAMRRKIITSLGSLFADAQELGLASRNPVRELHRNRKRGKARRQEKRQRRKLEAGRDFPTPQEAMLIVAHAQGRWRPLLITAILTGLRASELRGLTWANVDLKAQEIRIVERADRYNDLGMPKSESGQRVVPFGKVVLNALREWRLACPKGELGLVFPNGVGKVESLANIINRGLRPTVLNAGIVTADGKAKYTGMHVLRHFYASWCINRVEDGGRALPPKTVQERLGHATINVTLDIYGHLFKGDDAGEQDAAELRLIGKEA